jgi:nanoRNase/pAp phosphatase (c-di-AMP/oligoRNAs hydrolase)
LLYRLGIFRKLLKKSKKISIYCHQNADPDAVCSAFALKFLIKKLKKRAIVNIIVPDGFNTLGKRAADCIPIRGITEIYSNKADLIILVDTNNIRQLGSHYEFLKNLKTQIVVIDHHTPHPDLRNRNSCIIINEKISSTCEIVYEMYKRFKLKPSKKVSNAILIGIVYDSRHFILASSRCLINVAELIPLGASIKDAISIMAIPLSKSEIMARLKALQRLVILKVDNWIITSSEVGSYQASVARILNYVGAHVAIVGGKNMDEFIISLRCKENFHKKTGIHLGKDIAIPVAESLNCSGGGHAMAAGINGIGDLEDIIDKCISKIRERLS